MTAIEKHRQTWQGKSDEWLFERLNNELKQKVEEIHRLLAEIEKFRAELEMAESELGDIAMSDCNCQGIRIAKDYFKLKEKEKSDGKV